MFTEISIEPLPEHLEVDCDGEGSVIEAIDVCVFGAVDLILAKEEAEMAVRFAVVSMTKNCWVVTSMVPPLLTRDAAVLVDREDTSEPDPGAIDSWAALRISTVAPRHKTSVEDLGSGRTSLNLWSHEPEHRGSLLSSSSAGGHVLRSITPTPSADDYGGWAVRLPRG